jgi:D-alanyl-D-alanine carboxypeptidase
MSRKTLVATVAAALGTVLAPAAQASPETNRADRALQRSLREVVDAPNGPPGVIAVVQRGRERKVITAGVAELGGGRPKGREHMRIASTSKAFSGATALTLVSRGKLEFKDTVGEVLPELPAAWGEVTLAQALQHTSGIPSFTKDPDYLNALAADLENGPLRMQRLLDFVADEGLEFAPGTDYAYSNSDNIVAALMVEAVTGRSYRKVLGRRVLGPLGLSRTSLPKDVAMPAPFIHGYDLSPPAPPEDISEAIAPDWTSASGGMVSSPFDLNSFARAYADGELFSRQVQFAHKIDFVEGSSEPPGPGRNEAGMGVFSYRTDCGKVYGHTGNFPGYTQFFGGTKNGRRSVTVSANEQLSPDLKPDVFNLLRAADARGVCAALAR